MMNLLHADALIELLSAVNDDTLRWLGLSETQIQALGGVWEETHDHYEEVVGRPHPLATPSPADDDDTPVITVTFYPVNPNLH